MMSRALKANDVLELSRIYEPEFNKPELHDRVLVFDVMRDGWDKTAVLMSSFSESYETSETSQTPKKGKQEINQPKPVVDSSDDQETNRPDSAGFVQEAQKEREGEETVSIENESEIKNDTGSTFSDIDGSSCKETNSNELPVDKSETKTSILCKPATDQNDVLRQHKFFVHGSWLALQSSYFRSLFFSGMKESSCKDVHVKISQSEEKAHLQLLEAMYKADTLDNVGVAELLIILGLAHKYDAKFVFKKCKYVLQATKLSLQTCEKIMSFIKTEHAITDVEDLAATLQTFLAKEFSPLDKTWQTTSFRTLSQLSLMYLLSSDELITQSENTVFHALMHWLEQNGHDTIDPEKPLLSVVRFELMPIDYLYNVVQHHSIANKMAGFNGLYLKGVTYHALTSEIKERLTVTPVKRIPIAEDIEHCTWVIEKDDIQKLVSTRANLMSDVFWCCGYRMQLCLENVSMKSQGKNSRGVYTGNLGLQAVGLGNESALPVEWTLTSTTFPKKLMQHTFSLDSIKSSALINFTLDSAKINTKPCSLFGGLLSVPSCGEGLAAPSTIASGGLNIGTQSEIRYTSSDSFSHLGSAPPPGGGFNFSSPARSASSFDSGLLFGSSSATINTSFHSSKGSGVASHSVRGFNFGSRVSGMRPDFHPSTDSNVVGSSPLDATATTMPSLTVDLAVKLCE